MSGPSTRRGLYLSSQIATRIVSAMLGVYAARVLGPQQLGLWAVFQIVYLYTAQAHLGTVNAMLREVPVALAEHDEQRARNLVETTWGFVWTVAATSSCAVGLAVWLLFGTSDPHAAVLTIACAVLAFVQLHSVFFNFYCFAFSALTKLSIATLTQQLLTTIACVLLLARYGVAGYLLSMAIGFSVMWVATFVGPLPRLRPRICFKTCRGLVAVGLPMLPGALMLYFGTTLDRLFVASRLGVTALGFFTVGAFLFQFGAALWDMAIYTVYARLAALHAAADKNPETIAQLMGKLLPGAMWVSSALQGLLVIGAPLVIRSVLPGYGTCIGLAQILVLAINLFGAGQLFTSNLTVIGRERLSVIVRVAGLGLRAICLFASLAFSRTIAGLGTGIVIGQLAYAIFAVLIFRRVAVLPMKPAVASLGAWFMSSVAAIACATLARTGDTRALITAAMLYTCLLLVISLLVERRDGSISRFWSFARA